MGDIDVYPGLQGSLQSFEVITDTFTASGTWTKRPGLKHVRVRVVGGGGGGGGAGNNFSAGGGGGAGGYAESFLPGHILGATESITVGSAGSGAAAGNNAGGNGGTSSFGSHVSANGGSGGGAGSAAGIGGAGGAASIGQVKITGGAGGAAGNVESPPGGSGGSSAFGGGGRGGSSTTSNHGGAVGDAPGSGGGGGARGSLSAGGGAGAGGIVLVENYLLVEAPIGLGGNEWAAPSSTLAYAAMPAQQTGIFGEVDLTGLTVTFTVPADRRIRVSAYALMQQVGAAAANNYVLIRDAAGNLLTESLHGQPGAGAWVTHNPSVVLTPAAGTHTYKVSARTTVNSATIYSDAAIPAYILVEDITGVGVPGHTHIELDDTGWININTLGFQNGWVDYSGSSYLAQYRKKNGWVTLRGLIKSGAIDTVAFTLPVGFRPVGANVSQQIFATVAADAPASARVEPDGNVRAETGATSWFSLDGIGFWAD